MSLKKNVIANYIGQAWTALMSLVFVPFYIKYLGVESYGLIGVFTMLQAWLTLLDIGMTPTLNREMARYTAGAHDVQSIRDLLRTMEYLCLLIAALLITVVYFSSNWLAHYWLNTQKLPINTLINAINIMGIVIALRFTEGLYKSAIIGLQQQVLLNITNAILATVRSGGVVLVLIYISPTIELFFIWQSITSLITIIIFIFTTYQCLPKSLKKPQFSVLQLKMIWRFASGVMLTNLLALLLTQIDKIVLSRLLTLEMFGYYTLAGIISTAIFQIITPITQAYYPRFTELVTQKNTIELVKIYHQSARFISILIIPITIVLVFFGDKILLLWTNNEELTRQVMPLLILLSLGNMLNGLMHIPYLLTLAYGWVSFAIYQNIIAVILLVPSVILASLYYGAIGAAWIWLILNAGYILIAVHFLYRRLLTTEKWQWYKKDIMLPMLIASVTAWLCNLAHPSIDKKFIWLIWMSITGILMIFVSWLLSFNKSIISIKQK